MASDVLCALRFPQDGNHSIYSSSSEPWLCARITRPYPRQSDLIALGLGLGIIFLYYLLNQLD